MSRPLKVIHIEDSDADALLLQAELESNGFEITISRAQTEKEYLQLLQDPDWDLILSECSLPRFSAREALARLNDYGLDIPFIAIAGNIEEETAVGLLKSGADDLISKDRFARLAPAITRSLDDARERRSRQKAEFQRDESENRFKSIVDNLQESVVVMDAEGKVTFWNAAAEKLFGYQAEQMLGEALHDFIAPKRYRQAFATAYKHFLVTGRGSLIGKKVRIEALHADGSEFPVELSINSLLLEGAWHAIGVVRDLSEETMIKEQSARICMLQLREEALKAENENKLFKLFLCTVLAADFLPLGDNGSIYSYQNSSDALALVMNAGEWQAEQCSASSDDCLCKIAVQWRQIAFSKGIDAGSKKACCALRDSHVFYAVPMITDTAELKGVCMLNVNQDYTQDKKIEDILMRMGATMANIIDAFQNQKIVQKLSTAVEQSPTSILITDRNGVIEYANPKVTELTEYEPEEIIGQTAHIFKSGLTPDAVYKDLWDSLLGGQNWIGEIQNRNKSGGLFWEKLSASPIKDKGGQITNFIAIKEDITLRKNQERKLGHLSTHHPLTNLPNRALTIDRLKQAILHAQRYKGLTAILSLDISRLSLINDSLGHARGDEVIQLTGKRLTEAVRRSDTVGHIGSDEFVVVLTQPDNLEKIEDLVNKIKLGINCPTTLGEHRIDISCSMGVAVFPEHGDNADDLLRHADIARYQARSAGGNEAHYYSADSDRETKERLSFQGELRNAIDQKELVVHYQPLLDAKSGAMIGAEALVRWQHPERLYQCGRRIWDDRRYRRLCITGGLQTKRQLAAHGPSLHSCLGQHFCPPDTPIKFYRGCRQCFKTQRHGSGIPGS